MFLPSLCLCTTMCLFPLGLRRFCRRLSSPNWRVLVGNLSFPCHFVPLSFVILGGPSRNSPFGCGSAALCLCTFV
jgi:hypothetical protein